jgi:cytochrome c-type biogenesis protein
MTGLGVLVAFLAGIVSFASPCCLPLVPGYVGYMAGTAEPGSRGSRSSALRHGTAFVLGFTLVFVTLWASVGLVGYVLRDVVPLLRLVGGVALIVLGLHVAGLINIDLLYRDLRIPARRVIGSPAPRAARASGAEGTTLLAAESTDASAPTYRRSALLGVVFAAGWTPCVGPILGGIIGLASVSTTVAQGAVLLLAYSLGLGLPFLAVAVGAREVTRRVGWLRDHHATVSLVTGSLLVVVGFLMVTNLLSRLSGLVPAFGA